MKLFNRYAHAGLFSGALGFSLAAHWMGWRNILHCEIDERRRLFAKSVWPNAVTYEDIRKTDFTIHRGWIDILTGGFPCQPFSVAGAQRGVSDDRYLWPEMLRAVREIQPRWVVGENVLGITAWNGGMVFDTVHSDLEAEGYEVQAFLIPAAGVDAPHKRYRVWFVGYCAGRGGRCPDDVWSAAANSNISRCEEYWEEQFRPGKPAQNYGLSSKPGVRRRDDGIPYWVDRLEAMGDAIVPQVAVQIYRAIELYDAQY